MKVILNSLTNYKKKVLNIGDIEDVELRVADRWIKLGLAHLPEEIKTASKNLAEEVIFREPEIKEEVKEIDIIEPVPVDHFVDFETEVKSIKKTKKTRK